VAVRVEPLNTKSAPVPGTWSPTQLAAVLHLLSLPPPSQVIDKSCLASKLSIRKSLDLIAFNRFAQEDAEQVQEDFFDFFRLPKILSRKLSMGIFL
jgi:hypothetical protein